MSTFYANITLLDIEQSAVIDWLRTNNITAYVSPTIEQVTVVYPETGEEDDGMLLALAQSLSESVAPIALVARVRNDEQLALWLFEHGTIVSQHHPPLVIGDANQFASMLRSEADLSHINAVFQLNMLSATEQHVEIVDALNLPPTMVDMGFQYIHWEGEKPMGVEDNNDVIYVGNEDD